MVKAETETQARDALDAAIARAPRPITPRDRDDMIRSIIGSQALEGIELAWDDVARIVDEVLAEPPLTYTPPR
jgi:hypothetical protein